CQGQPHKLNQSPNATPVTTPEWAAATWVSPDRRDRPPRFPNADTCLLRKPTPGGGCAVRRRRFVSSYEAPQILEHSTRTDLPSSAPCWPTNPTKRSRRRRQVVRLRRRQA